MPSINDSSGEGPPHPLSRFVVVRHHEISALMASFAMFFALLAAYYIVRPVRDEMGVEVGKDEIHHLFTMVFFVMLAAVPAFGLVATRFPRRLVLPSLYAFFALNLIGFWVVFRFWGIAPAAAGTFFVWASVFNLFVVSLFWSLMSELWSTQEAKRLYGFIGAGGTAGALAGPLLAQGLLRIFQPVDLLPVSALLLAVALGMSLVLRAIRPGHGEHETEPAGGGILDGAVKVMTDPFFARIAGYVLLANIVGTFFYMEQSRLVGAAIADSAERVKFFASRDLAVSIITLTVELVGTAYVLNKLGVAVALLALPIVAAVSVLALSSHPILWVVAAAMVAERVCAFSLSSPAIKLMYTLATPAEKYKVQSFVDTVVYRGGDAVSGWAFSLLGAGAGFASAVVPAVALPLVGLWLWNARALASVYDTRSRESHV
ncbi:MAG: MFS transporter [Hyphomicrobiaceae bacterium]